MLAPRRVPSVMAFRRLTERFIASGQTQPQAFKGSRPALTDESVERVREFVRRNPRKKALSVRQIANSLGISFGTVWRILRKKLMWYPYKPHAVIPLSDAHKTARLNFCQWLLRKPDGFEENVIWTDEKWFVLHQSPNKQNERFWAPCDPGVEVTCRVQGDEKVMCWAAIVRGRVVIHWLEPNVSVNGAGYLDILKSVLWPQVRVGVRKYGLWYRQDGATVHTTTAAREWLKCKFDGRVISRLTDRPWPAKSPDLSPLDFWFWSVAMAELRRDPPPSIQSLKSTVEAFVDSLDPEEINRSVQHLRRRARACIDRGGGTFEDIL